jgi:hypothetical protein
MVYPKTGSSTGSTHEVQSGKHNNTLQKTRRDAERKSTRGPNLNNVCTVVVEVPELAIVLVVRPPERVGTHACELLVLLPHAPTNVERERMAVLLEQRVDARDAPVPGVFQVLLKMRIIPGKFIHIL